MHDQPEQDIFSPSAILNLQTKLHELQMEKNDLSDLRWTVNLFLHKIHHKELWPTLFTYLFSTCRLKDSRKHTDQMEKSPSILEELQNVKRSTEKLQESEDEVLELHRKAESLERFVKEIYQTLSEKRCGNALISSDTGQSQAQAVHGNKDLKKNSNELQTRRFSVSSYIYVEIHLVHILKS